MLLPCGNAYLRKLSVQSVQSVFEKNKRQEDNTRNPFNPYYPCSKNTKLLI